MGSPSEQGFQFPFNISMFLNGDGVGNHSLGNFTWPQMFFDDEFTPEVQALLSVIYSLTILLSVVGNVLVIIVLVFGNRVKTELTVFLLNLAAADLCMACFCMPFTFTETMIGKWVFGAFMCPFVSFMQITSVSVNIFTNMAIGIDRFWGIIYPLKRKLTRTRAKLALVIIWVAACTLALAQLFITRAQSMEDVDGGVHWTCDEVWSSNNSRKAYTVAIGAFTYVIPLTVISFTYYKVGSRLWVRNAPGEAHQSRDRILLRSKRKVIKMVVALVLAFAICWLPLQVFNQLIEFCKRFSLPKSRFEEHLFFGVYITCHWMAMANSFFNPIIYSFLNESFRADLKALFWWLPCIKLLGRGTSHGQGDVLTYTMSTRTSFALHSRGGSRHLRIHQNVNSAAVPLRPLTDGGATPGRPQNGDDISGVNSSANERMLGQTRGGGTHASSNGETLPLTRTLLGKPDGRQDDTARDWSENVY